MATQNYDAGQSSCLIIYAGQSRCLATNCVTKALQQQHLTVSACTLPCLTMPCRPAALLAGEGCALGTAPRREAAQHREAALDPLCALAFLRFLHRLHLQPVYACFVM